MPCTIRGTVPADVPELVEIIRTAFRDVALRFDLTPENCPRPPPTAGSHGLSTHWERALAISSWMPMAVLSPWSRQVPIPSRSLSG